jgi:uncharacterized protein YaiI (UPF0178 family)
MIEEREAPWSPGRRSVQIWVDGDACPKVIKEILFRAAERMQVPMILVANKLLWTPPSPFIRGLRVPHGFDVADREIVEKVQAGDLVVTADIPLAAAVIGRDAHALDPRGVLYTKDNVQERLAVRNLMDQLRASGVETGGPAPWSQSDSHAFANQLDRLLSAHAKADSSKRSEPRGGRAPSRGGD